MLDHINIRDFAIIENIDLDFDKGLHVLTGETGSGKSILIEAISMALGSRADTSYIRSGCDKAQIEISALAPQKTLNLLKKEGLSDEDNLFILRELHQAGKSISRVNGNMVSLSMLNTISKDLADIHGQYDNQSLLDNNSHIILLDRYGKTKIEETLTDVSNLFLQYEKVKNKLNKLQSSQAESTRNKDFMEFELNEILSADLVLNEDEDLHEQLNILKNAELLSEGLHKTYELLFGGDDSALDKLNLSMHTISDLKSFSQDYTDIYDNISSSFYSLEDLQGSLRHLKDSVVFSPESINQTQERLDLLERLKKKYGGSIEKIFEYQENLEHKLTQITDSDSLIKETQEELFSIEEKLQKSSNKLSQLRKEVAKSMEEDIEKELKELNFNDAKLITSILPLGTNDNPTYTSQGINSVEFLIVTNKGEEPKPLSKIASGGEISRIMLAFKKILGAFDNIPCLIFDEIDSGISGATASIVGRKLKEISETHQVICITHLAQIAAYADHHYQIYKEESDGRTVTSVKPLNNDEKLKEIARLLGGLHITETTLKNAQELLTQSKL